MGVGAFHEGEPGQCINQRILNISIKIKAQQLSARIDVAR